MQPLRRADPPHDYRAELFELIRTRSFGRGKIMTRNDLRFGVVPRVVPRTRRKKA